MSRRAVLFWLWLLLAWFLPAEAQPPNILLLIADDLSAAFTGPYGDTVARTPALDQLARDGLTLERFYVSAPQCIQSRAALLTGQSPVRIQMTRFGAPLRRSVRIFPEALRAAGYFTAIVGRTHHMDGHGLEAQPEETRQVFARYQLQTMAERVDYLNIHGETRVLAQFQAALARWPRHTPFFVQVSFYDPHRPFTPNAALPPTDPAQVQLPPFFPDTPRLRRDLAAYYDEIGRLDQDVARVLALLDVQGLTASTLVVFLGDNGAGFLRAKGTLYELGLRVPLLVRWPGRIAPGRRSPALLSGEDLAPTLLDVAGVPRPGPMRGRSFAGLLTGGTFRPRASVVSSVGAQALALPGAAHGLEFARTITSPRFKLIYNALWPLPYAPLDELGHTAVWQDMQAQHQAGTLPPHLAQLYFAPSRPLFELYDLLLDPYEMTNVAGRPDLADVERTLKAQLQEWMILNEDHLPLPVPP